MPFYSFWLILSCWVPQIFVGGEWQIRHFVKWRHLKFHCNTVTLRACKKTVETLMQKWHFSEQQPPLPSKIPKT